MTDEQPASFEARIAAPLQVAGVSAAVLLLQLLQTRLFSVIYWNHVVYFIISVALLGFGVAGTLLAMGPDTWLARRLTVRRAGVLFVAATLAATLAGPWLAVSLATVSTQAGQVVRLLCTYLVAVLPYLFAGWVLGAIFRDHARRIHTLYFADLASAAGGCLLFVGLIRPLGLVSLLLVACLLVAVPCLLSPGGRRPWLAPLLVALLLVPVAARRPAVEAGIRSEPTKGINSLHARLAAGDAPVHERSEWNAISRIDVVSTRYKPRLKRVFIDGDAWTYVATPEAGADLMSPVYRIRPRPRAALIIGAGGGVDVTIALRAGASAVEAVEINPSTTELMRTVYRADTRGLFLDPRVRLEAEEGRSYVRRSASRYDVIALHGIDTFAAQSAGAYVLSENYLYTVEAFVDYLRHLADDGIVSVTRWGTPEESLRLFVVAVEALARLGVTSPEGHVRALLVNGWIHLLVKRTPYTPAQAAAFVRETALPATSALYPPAEGLATYPGEYLRHRARGEHQGFLARLPFDASPVFDDSPFFFHFERWLRVAAPGRVDAPPAGDAAALVRGNWPTLTLFGLLGLSAVVVALGMVLPVVVTRRRAARPPWRAVAPWLLYFSCLGFAFIFIEIALMQRFALVLGHPSRALVAVLGTLLGAAGVGSYASARLRLAPVWCMALIVGLTLALAYGYPPLLDLLLPRPLWLRVLATCGLVFPLGFFLGVPFPAGLAEVAGHHRDVVPWMWAANGATSVFGSILAIVLAMGVGFTAVLQLAAAGYLVALLVFLRLRGGATRRGETASR
jgi:spermidine synthase